jgi:hypothetical protein
MFYYALVKFRNEQLENYQGPQLKYSASDYHHISRGQARLSKHLQNRSHGPRRSQVPAVKETGKRRRPTKEPKSSCTVESYDPFRSPFNRAPEGSPEYARVTIHRDKPASPPKQTHVQITALSNPFLGDEQEEIGSQQSPSFTVVHKKRPKVNSVKSFHSKASLSGSRRAVNRMSTPRSASYKRGVSFRHTWNRSQGSMSLKTKRGRTGYKRQQSEGSLISVFDDDPFSDPYGSPMLPAQPAVVRGAGIAIKSTAERRVQHSDIIWKDDARKVSHELSQICEEAFNGSSLSTGCTDTTCVGSETPATSISIASPGISNDRLVGSSSTVCLAPRTLGDSPKSTYASKELEETRRRLIEHSSKGGSKDIPGYLAKVISHLDRLIEQEKTRTQGRKLTTNEGHSSASDLFSGSALDESHLPVISEELKATTGCLGKHNHQGRHASDSTAASSQRSDISGGKRSIRMVPQSSFQSIGNADPLTVHKQRSSSDKDGVIPELDNTQPVASRAASINSRYCRSPCELDPIDEHPASPRRGGVRVSDHKKWSWFRKSQNIEEDAARTPKVVKPLHPSSATVIVHESNAPPEALLTPGHQQKPLKPSSNSQKSSFWRFMKRKSSRNSGKSTFGRLTEP